MAERPEDRERARRVLTALRELPPGVLDAVADHAVGTNADLLARVRGALAGADPEAELAQALRGVALEDVMAYDPADTLALGRQIAATGRGAAAPRARLLAGPPALAARGDESRAEVAAAGTDPELASILDDALALLGDDGPFVALREAVAALGGAEELFAAIERGGDNDRDVAAQLASLRAQRDALAKAAARIAEIPALLDRARAHAIAHGDLKAEARLATAAAALRRPGEHDRDAWAHAFDLAVAADLLDEARGAAYRLDMLALAAGKLDDVIATQTRLAALAAELGDPDVELAASGSLALAYAQQPEGDAAAERYVARAQALAEDDPSPDQARRVRAALIAAQVAEKLGHVADARIAFRRAIAVALEHGRDHELGWAALHLGRLEAAGGQPFQSAQNLALAQEVGARLGDALLVGLAAAARIDLAPDRAAAEHVLAEVEAAPADVRAELARRIDARW